MIKAIYVIRRDLNMSGPKIAVQVGHGTDFVHTRPNHTYTSKEGRKYTMCYCRWMGSEGNRRKSVVGIKTEKKIKNVIKILKDNNIRFDEIWDAGYTELDGETMTGIVIHPIEDDELPKAVRRLRLLDDKN